ncbi:MAG: hypothetical protein KAS92_00685, partial [Candidatus Omnitrophica bacterium]|nr:hypothetical protein [Candidatus Omnitrophota bacterium]
MALVRDEYVTMDDRIISRELLKHYAAQRRVSPQRLGQVVQHWMPAAAASPIQTQAIEAMAQAHPAHIQAYLEAAGIPIAYADQVRREVEILRVALSDPQTFKQSQRLIGEKSYIGWALSTPSAAVSLSQMARPVNPGDERIASVEDAREIARFSSSPVIVQTHSGEINLIVPSGAKTRSIPVTEKVAIDIHAQNIDPVYAGYSFQETRDMKQEVFMLRVRPALRGKYRAADFMNIPNRSDILRVEKSVPASMKRQGIDLKDIKVAVVPTKFKNVSLATVSAKGYKDIMAQQKKAASPVSGEKIYFMEGEKGKVTFLRFSSDRKNPLGWKTKEIVTAPELISRMYEGDVTMFARNRELIDQATAFELFENKSYFKYHGNMVNFTNALDMSESERGGFLKAEDLIDEQLSDTFGSNQPKVKGSWKVRKGVRVARDTKNTADLVSVKGVGIVLDISEDLAKTRDPERIRMRLRNMTVKQW